VGSVPVVIAITTNGGRFTQIRTWWGQRSNVDTLDLVLGDGRLRGWRWFDALGMSNDDIIFLDHLRISEQDKAINAVANSPFICYFGSSRRFSWS
jgi:hypothetical protein